MKKYICIALFAFMTLNLCLTSVAFANSNDVLVIYSAECNNASDIVAFSTPKVKMVNDDVAKKLGENNYAACLETLTGTTGVTSNYMRINLTDDNSKTYTAYNSNINNDKKIVYKTKFYFTSAQVNEFIRHFSTSENSPQISFGPKITATATAYASKAPFNANYAFYLKENKFVYGNLYGTPVEISADTWHEYTAMVDFSTHKADVYIDDTNVALGVSLNNKTITVSEALMCGIEFFDGTTSKSDTNSVRVIENGIYFDDIKIYQGIGNLAADADITPKDDGTYDINVNFSTEIDAANAALIKVTDGFGVSINAQRTLSADGKKVVFNIFEEIYNGLEKINVTIPTTFRDVNYQSFSEDKLITVTLQTNKIGFITESAQTGELDTAMSAGKNDFRPSNATVTYVNDTVSQKLGAENNALKITYANSSAIKMGRKTIPGGAFSASDYGDINQNKPLYTKAKIYIPSATVEKLGAGYLQFGIGSKDNATVAVPGGRIYKDETSSTGLSMRIGRGRATSGSSAISGYATYEVPVDTWFEYATELSFSYSEKTSKWDYAKSRVYLNGQALEYEGAYDITPASWYDNGFNGYMMIASGDVAEDAQVYLDNIEVYQTSAALTNECDVLYDEYNKLIATVEFTNKIDINSMKLVSLTFADGTDASEYIVSKTVIGGKTVKYVLDDEKLNGNGDFKIVIPTSFHDVNYQKLSENSTEYLFSVPNYREVYVKTKTDAIINDDLSSVSGSVVVANRSAVAKNAWIAFAVYAENNELIGVDTAIVENIVSGEERTIDFTAIGEAGTFGRVTEIKTLIWDFLSTMRPYQNAEQITVAQVIQ